MTHVDLHAQVLGDGPPLIFLHGLYGSGNNWRGPARRLAREYRVVLPDLRNHGRSPHHRRMDYPTMADDVAALMAREHIASATVIGHSMGGKTAMALALSAPQRVHALVAVDIAPVAYAGHGSGGHLEAMRDIRLERLRSRADADAALAAKVPEATVRQFLLTNLQRVGDHWRWRIPLDILAAALPALEGWPGPHGHYDGPALFLHGGRSDYLTEAEKPAVGRYFPAFETVAVPRAGHWVHVDAPDAFMDALLDFLRRGGPHA